jgi:hypothetical protein
MWFSMAVIRSAKEKNLLKNFKGRNMFAFFAYGIYHRNRWKSFLSELSSHFFVSKMLHAVWREGLSTPVKKIVFCLPMVVPHMFMGQHLFRLH